LPGTSTCSVIRSLPSGLSTTSRALTTSGWRLAIAASIREITKLRGEVAFRGTGELPNDGKVIDDVRKYE
jgi:hypothetical protein